MKTGFENCSDESLIRLCELSAKREDAAMNDESNALMMQVMCNKDPTVRCAGQCDDPQCVTNANRNVTVSFSCPNCPTHLAQIESLTREKAHADLTITTMRKWEDTLRAELDAAKRNGVANFKRAIKAELNCESLQSITLRKIDRKMVDRAEYAYCGFDGHVMRDGIRAALKAALTLPPAPVARQGRK